MVPPPVTRCGQGYEPPSKKGNLAPANGLSHGLIKTATRGRELIDLPGYDGEIGSRFNRARLVGVNGDSRYSDDVVDEKARAHCVRRGIAHRRIR
jgi:hypothetical protein